MEGFLSPSVLNTYDKPTNPKCGKCGLFRKCNSPKMPMTGEGGEKILVVAEAPGKNEDEENTQLIGKSGQLLRKHLRECGIDLDRDCWKTNAVICYPGDTPTPKQVEYCFANLRATIKETNPEIIIVLGGTAVSSLIGWLWKSSTGKLSRWVGWQIPDQKLNAWICPTYHPSYILRKDESIYEEHFHDHLEAAVSLRGRPHPKEPRRWHRDVRIITNTGEAADAIKKIVAWGEGLAAFDFETDRLKPDSEDAKIVCCSISHDGKTIAFPWYGCVPSVMKRFMESERIGKIAANIKFEHRWVKAKLGIDVANWAFDTMQAAHQLDNRKGVTGLKFQSYVRLGQPSYDEHIAPWLKAKLGNEQNRISKISTRELLLYCGMDSLLEYKLALMQMEELGV